MGRLVGWAGKTRDRTLTGSWALAARALWRRKLLCALEHAIGPKRAGGNRSRSGLPADGKMGCAIENVAISCEVAVWAKSEPSDTDYP